MAEATGEVKHLDFMYLPGQPQAYILTFEILPIALNPLKGDYRDKLIGDQRIGIWFEDIEHFPLLAEKKMEKGRYYVVSANYNSVGFFGTSIEPLTGEVIARVIPYLLENEPERSH